LARNSADWHRLIELCALTATLILDEDGIYDPAGFNDRLLLGLKGTMSEAELHILKARMRHLPTGGTAVIKMPRAEWQFVMPDQHRGYINWERFESNQRRMADNARAFGGERRSGPPREGPALLQGRVLCGLCGERMGVHYRQEHRQTVPVYVCQEAIVRRGGKTCQSIAGSIVDVAVGALLVELMTPMTLEVTLAVQRELEARAAEIDVLRRQHLERTRYEAELARQRYMHVDPGNRLVADALEAEWNDKLRVH